MITLFFLKDAELDLNGQVKSKRSALIVLCTILVDTIIAVNVLHYIM
jgi:hypothetical protein